MTMADETRLNILLKEYIQSEEDTAYNGAETEGITQGENWVTRYIKKHLPAYSIVGTEQDIIDAATLRSASAILKILQSNHDKLSPTVVEWDKEAQECLDLFIEAYETTNEKSSDGANILISVIHDPDQMDDDVDDD